MHKTPASTNLFFLNSALCLRPLFTLCRFPGNPILAVLLPWELKSQSQVCVVSTWMTLSKEACRDPSFITLFFSGSKVTELTLAYTWLPIPPSPTPPTHTAVIDCRRRWLDQISYSWSMRLFSRSASRASLTQHLHSSPHLLPWEIHHRRLQLLSASFTSTLTVIVMLKTHLGIYSKCFSINILKKTVTLVSSRGKFLNVLTLSSFNYTWKKHHYRASIVL